MLQATQDYSRVIFLVQKVAENLFDKNLIKIEPYAFQANAPAIPDLILESNEIIFFTEIGYTCIDEINRTQFEVYNDFEGNFYTFQAEIATNVNRFKISDKLTSRWCQSIRNITSTSYIYGVGYLLTFKK